MIFGVDVGVRSVYLAGLPEETDIDTEPVLATHIIATPTLRWSELRDLALTITEYVSVGDCLFVEEPPLAGSLNIRSALQLNQTVGAILCATAGQGYLVPVSSWKKATVGSGAADKPVVAAWLEREHPDLYRRCDGDQNLMDACCIALYGQHLVDVGRDLRAECGGVDLSL